MPSQAAIAPRVALPDVPLDAFPDAPLGTPIDTSVDKSLDTSLDTADSMTPPDRQARRLSLREFQRQLVVRTQHARADNNSPSLRLAVQAGDQRLLLDVAHTFEVIPCEGVTPVPHTCAWFLGLINCRGKLTGVIDFPGFMGYPVMPLQDSDRLLVLSDALAAPCALRVTRVPSLVSLSGFSDGSKPDAEPAWVSGVYIDRDAQPWRLLDLSLLTNDPAFLTVVAQ